MQYQAIVNEWMTSLKLTEEPVAIAFVDQPPTGVQRSSQPAPSACTFWRRGQRELFYATADDHANCPIGLMTMGFRLTPEKGEQAQGLVGVMAGLHYFDPSEVAQLPTIKKQHRAVVYGPLSQFPIEPDLIILLLNPHQSMLASETLGRVTWAETAQLGVFGRPACAALPKAEQIRNATLSLGCIGARTYTDLPEAEMLLVVPAGQFQQATAQLNTVVAANRELAGFHRQQREQITA